MKFETAVQWLRSKMLIECLEPSYELFEQALKMEKKNLEYFFLENDYNTEFIDFEDQYENFTIKNINNKK